MKKNKFFATLLITTVLAVLSVFLIYQTEEYRYKVDRAPLSFFRFLVNLEWSWYDSRLRSRNPENSQYVSVAKIDDQSLSRFGRWPWSRALYPQIIASIYTMGAESLGFDAVFSEPEFRKVSIADSLTYSTSSNKALKDELGLAETQIQGISDGLDQYGENRFARGLMDHSPTVLGYIWLNSHDCKIYDPDSPNAKELSKEPLSKEQAQQKGFMHVDELSDHLTNITEQAIMVKADLTVETEWESFPCPISNRGALSKSALYQGYFIAPPESDGVFRRISLVVPLKLKSVPESARGFLPEEWNSHAVFFPSLSLQTFIASVNPNSNKKNSAPKPEIIIEKSKNGTLEIKAIKVLGENNTKFEIPTLPDGSVLINFLGTQDNEGTENMPSIAEFSLAEVPFSEDKIQLPPNDFSDERYRKVYGIKSENEKPLRGRSVLIGPTALGVYDLRPNPVQETAAGVFLHANLLSRLLEFSQTGKNKISLSFVKPFWVSVIFVILIYVYTLFMTPASATRGAMYSIVCLVILATIDRVSFLQANLVFPFVTMIVAFAAVSVSLLAYKYFTEERERAFVKGAFQKFVSPDLIREIEADPSKLKLGGEKKDLSVLFSDIRGFTTISERMKADELAKFMNDYLTPMTEIVLENRGTIDKYMGDAIMAIFGAPVPYANHAEKAVDTALGMMKKLGELQTEWRSKGLPPMDIGIGVNSGEMSVGNMGSTRIMAYTVMGDNVNLGSRLESINKKYHTHIIISETTRSALGPEYIVRELDRVKVKGKNKPVTIFEVVGKDAVGFLPVDDQKMAVVKRFGEAMQLYYAQKFVEAKLLFEELLPLDETSEDFIGRCESYIAAPPGQGWDGSSTMDSK